MKKTEFNRNDRYWRSWVFLFWIIILVFHWLFYARTFIFDHGRVYRRTPLLPILSMVYFGLYFRVRSNVCYSQIFFSEYGCFLYINLQMALVLILVKEKFFVCKLINFVRIKCIPFRFYTENEQNHCQIFNWFITNIPLQIITEHNTNKGIQQY